MAANRRGKVATGNTKNELTPQTDSTDMMASALRTENAGMSNAPTISAFKNCDVSLQCGQR